MLTTVMQTGKARAARTPNFAGSVRSRSIHLSRTVDFDKPLPLWYWILMVSVLFALIPAVADGLNRNIPLSRTGSFIRVGLGGFWAILIIVGMALNIWKAYR
jgi:hypothetical protein